MASSDDIKKRLSLSTTMPMGSGNKGGLLGFLTGGHLQGGHAHGAGCGCGHHHHEEDEEE